MTDSIELFPNLGAEEGDGWRRSLAHSHVRQMAWMWRWLFPSASRWVGVDAEEIPARADWPAVLGSAQDDFAFEWLRELGDFLPWLATDEAHALGGRGPSAPDARVVARVHDKAFALQVAESTGFTPRGLRGLVHVYDPDDLRRPVEFADELAARITDWPDWTGRRFTLKPRWGSSARGRVAGDAGTLDSPSLRGAWPRLADRGGAVLEPWLARRDELATPLRVTADGGISVVGSLRPWTTPAGGLLGHRGGVDSRGRVFSESAFEEPAREAAAAVAIAASQAGFRGPCGVDAFAYGRPGEGVEFRPVVEFNARFTAGLVSVGLIRRVLPSVRSAIGLEPGNRRAFLLGLGAPPSEPGLDPWDEALRRAGPGAKLLRFGPSDGSGVAGDAAVLFAESQACIDAALDRAAT